MGDWLKEARDEISRESQRETSGQEELIAAATGLNDLVMRKLRDVNAQLLGNQGALLDFTMESLHPADLAFKMVLGRYYRDSQFAGVDPVVWSLRWSPSDLDRDGQLAVVLVPGAKRDTASWHFAVNVEPVDVASELFGDGDHDSPEFQGPADEANLIRLVSDACKRGAHLFRSQ